MILDNPFTEGLPYPKRVYYEAKSLINNGYDVTLYCKNEIDMNLPKFEIRDGIKINRCFDFYLGTTMLVDKYLKAHFDLINCITEKYDVYHCHDTFTWPIGYILSKRDNAKFICETHEYFPDYICKEWHTDMIKYEVTKMLVNIRGNYMNYADKVITVSVQTAEELKEMFKLDEKPIVIYNTRPIEFSNSLKTFQNSSKNILREKYYINKNTRILLFQGLVEPTRGLDIAISIMKYLKDCVLVIAGQDRGDYISELIKLTNKIGVEDKVIFTGYMTSDDLFKYSSFADFMVYFGKNVVKNMDVTIPNKFFDYIMVGKPIISSSLKSLEDIISKHEIGIAVDIEKDSIKDLAEQIQSYINDKELTTLAKKNLRDIQDCYCWEKQEEKLIEAYKDL